MTSLQSMTKYRGCLTRLGASKGVGEMLILERQDDGSYRLDYRGTRFEVIPRGLWTEILRNGENYFSSDQGILEVAKDLSHTLCVRVEVSS